MEYLIPKWKGLLAIAYAAAGAVWVANSANPWISAALVVLVALVALVYFRRQTLAWRYLFPGVVGMLMFVAFPLLYTVFIGFSNYSSSHLLTQERSRAYLLEQATLVENTALQAAWYPSTGGGGAGGASASADSASSVNSATTGYTLILSNPEQSDAPRYISQPLPLGNPDFHNVSVPVRIMLPGDMPRTAPLSLKQVLEHRDTLTGLKVELPAPNKTVLAYTGVQEFGQLHPRWLANADGSLLQTETGTVYHPNLQSGFFESASGEKVQPGFKVGIGWKNYSYLLLDPDIRGPLVSIFIWTVVFSGLTVLLCTAVGLSLAVLLNWEGLRFRTVYRTLLFLPYAVPGFISILVFKGLFNQNFGEINAILDAVFGVRPAWFSDPFLAKAMLVIVNTWLGYPYIMILCTGLIKAIPADLYEASAIAGAGPMTNFFKITLPLIIKPLTPLLVSAFAFNFNNFVLISLLTNGLPDYLNTKLPAGTTDILVSYTYRIAFTGAESNFGLAAAISTMIFVLVALLSLLNLRLTKFGQEAKH